MSIVRRSALSLSALILVFSLLGVAWSHAASATVLKRDTIKKWLVESDAYDSVAGIALQAASDNLEEQGQGALPVADPQLQTVAKDAFSPEFLQQNTEKVLDGTYAWLGGETNKLDFDVDISIAKQKLADGLGNYAIKRAESLPACTAAELPALREGYDILNAKCLPPGVSPLTVGAELRNKLLSSGEFLDQTQLSGEDLKVTENGRQIRLDSAQSTNKIRTAYSVANVAPYLYGLLALLATPGLVLLSRTKRAGAKRASIIYIVAGILLGFSYMAINFIRGQFDEHTLKLTGGSYASQEAVLSLMRIATQDISSLLLPYAAGFILFGIAGLLFCRFFRPPGKNLKQPLDPEPPIDDSPKSGQVTFASQTLRHEPTTAPEVPRSQPLPKNRI